MKRKRDLSIFYAVLAGVVLFFLPLCLFVGFVVWASNSPSELGIAFPEGTKILEESDTHHGLFRRKGIAIVVAQIPLEERQDFGRKLHDNGAIATRSVPDDIQDLLEDVEVAAPVLESGNLLRDFRDEAIAFAEEMFSDYFAVVYDLDSGICCCIEYDT